ncbi:arabinosyltransferase domain-containing protein [Mycolicibacterium sp.]|uniref:arabinosyltransferase domain-containing protein n=1 Tax=Mycolicibacterium sp. TaxID=2320850 RepID=UPI001A1C3299|nr:arabinosyltransferase domain-containing protein [Mycolicibacterium sp.]MBJ7338620.1 arabinosyltransferase domain-containing protein [Mycolicibacterium sp.]
MIGVLAGCALPFAPVWVATTTITWPEAGQAVASTSAIVAPYRPTEMSASVPCSALSAATKAGPTVAALATGAQPGALVVTGDAVRFGGALVDLRANATATATGDCRAVLTANSRGVSVLAPDGRRTDLPDQLVPEVFGFHTDLTAAAAAGISVTARVTDPFTTSPSAAKVALIAVQLGAAGVALAVLWRSGPRRGWRRPRWRRAWWVDVGVLVTLAGWALIGPLAVDDGWASMIARNVVATGNPGNYYRWWNAAEVPFAFSQELLAPWTAVSTAPLWLRVPSTLLAMATWFALSRGVLGAALPVRAGTARVRLLAAACLLAAWLPFNLGTRPESYVALGVTVALALVMRARYLRDLGLLALVIALVLPISPNGILVAAPIVVFAPRLLAVLRAGSPTRVHLYAHLLALGCLVAVGLVVIFADQTWDALVTASDWHTFFGPALPWYDEPDRYRYLLESGQQGSAPKRLPVLLALAMIPVVILLAYPRRYRDFVGRAGIRTAAVVTIALALFAVSPSKWSYHLGAAAGLFAALLVVGVVLVVRRARSPDRYLSIVGVGGSALLIAAVALAFDGPNAWWLPASYDVPWASEPPRPLGIPLHSPLPWLVAVVVLSVVIHRRRPAAAPAGSPAVVVPTAVGVVLALLLGSFAVAPLRRPEGSLAMANLHRIDGSRVCGLADDIQVLPDGPVLAASNDGGEQLAGFGAQAGFPPDAPPPDPPGTGTSAYLWGSRTPDEHATGTLLSRWFDLPPQPANGGVAVSVSGRTDGANHLGFEFGRTDGPGVVPLGERTPVDRPAIDEDPAHPLWRSIGIDASAIPADANRVRLRAVDGRADDLGWLAVTGPRLRSTIALTAFLDSRGPVLIGWPVAFLFPCIRDIVTVSAGVATTPRTVIESPRPFLDDDRRREIGGVFAALTEFGALHEIPSRLVGHPEVDWGTVQVYDDVARDAYQRTVTHALVPGIDGAPHATPER